MINWPLGKPVYESGKCGVTCRSATNILPSSAKHGLCRRAVFGWVSVCLPVTFVYCVKTAKDTSMVAINHAQALEWYHFQWPWMTPNPESCKVTALLETLNVSATVKDRILCYLPISNNLKWQSKTLTFRMHLLVKIEFKISSRYAIFSYLCLYFVLFLYSLLFSMFIALCLWLYLHLCFISCSLSVSS